jgi:hypothetical protein
MVENRRLMINVAESRFSKEDGDMTVRELRQSPLMSHLMEALERGDDIGHYGRLTFAMTAHHFMERDEVAKWLAKDRSMDEGRARALAQQVEERGYNPPRRERILEWQAKQEFPICPDPQNPDACNLYTDLELPEEVYDSIEEYHEQKV